MHTRIVNIDAHSHTDTHTDQVHTRGTHTICSKQKAQKTLREHTHTLTQMLTNLHKHTDTDKHTLIHTYMC